MANRSTASAASLSAACILSAAGALVFNAFPMFLSTIADQFQLNDEQLGLLGTTYLGGFAVLALTAVIWISRFNARVLSVGGYAVIAVSVLALLFVETPVALYWVMGGLGIGAGVIFTLGLEILAHSRDPDRAFGFKLCAEMLLAGLLMFVMTSLVINLFGYYGFVVGVLIVYGLTALAVVILPKGNISLVLEETVALEQVGNFPAWLAATALFIQFGVFSALWGFMERIGSDMGVAEQAIGDILSLSVFAGLMGATLGAAVGNRFGQVRPLLFAFALTVISILSLYYGRGTAQFLVAACTINALLQICVIYQMGLVTTTDHSGKVTVFIAFILAAGGAVGPGVAGVLIESYGFDALYLVLGTTTALTAILTIFAGIKLAKISELAEQACSEHISHKSKVISQKS